jgi:hypothetical protein
VFEPGSVSKVSPCTPAPAAANVKSCGSEAGSVSLRYVTIAGQTTVTDAEACTAVRLLARASALLL